MKSSIKERGFTLLEVLISFSLLATLLAVVVQSQGESAFFLEKTKKLSLVHKEVINELLRIERTYSVETFNAENGVFPSGHPLAGDQWEREIVEENFMGMVPVKKITYRISWNVGGGKGIQSFEDSIFGEVK
ncbi:type II secretion system GspH family protein [bacterium]|nr:type II secretion system GspH family protein [bacterium]